MNNSNNSQDTNQDQQKYKAQRNTKDEIGFFNSLLGLAVSPWETTSALLSDERPRFIFRFLLHSILVIMLKHRKHFLIK